jgi:hypothetical protein
MSRVRHSAVPFIVRVMPTAGLLLSLASGEAQAQTAEGSAAAARVPVHFAAGEPGVTVYSRPVPAERLTGAEVAREPSEFETVCKAPCDAALDPTVHEFALAPAGGAPIPAAPAFEIRSDARFRGDIISHQAERTAGFWILGIMSTVGITSTTIGMMQTCVDDQNCQEWTSLAIWSGIAVTTAGALIGLPKIATSDEATLTLVPGTAPLTNPVGALPRRAEHASAIPSGATVVLAF